MAFQTLLRACGLTSTGDARRLNAKPELFNEDEDGFRHGCVEVSYIRGNVRLGTSFLPVSAVNGIDWESARTQRIPLPWPPRVTVRITTNSVNHPTHEVAFTHYGAHESAEQFTQRFKAAIEKAGGPPIP